MSDVRDADARLADLVADGLLIPAPAPQLAPDRDQAIVNTSIAIALDWTRADVEWRLDG